MIRTIVAKYGAKAVKRAAILGFIALLWSSFVVAQAVTSTSSTESVFLANQTFTSDPDVSIAWQGLLKAGSNQSAAGTSVPGVEATGGMPESRTALIKNNFIYIFQLKEVANTSWSAGRQYRADVYGDDGTNTILLGTLYFQNATADAGSIEGVTIKVDQGSSTSTYDSFTIVVTRIQ